MDQKDMTEWYNERAAIYEYDGGLTRMEAEQRAWKELEELKLKGKNNADNRNQKRGTD